jgi:hypothetical protein
MTDSEARDINIPLHTSSEGYYIQDSSLPTLCTALSLVNAIHAAAPSITLPEHAVRTLVGRVPLSPEVVDQTLADVNLRAEKPNLSEEAKS